MAYEPKLAAALSGISSKRLGYWRTTHLLTPEVSARAPVLYSYRDLVALRTVAYLRDSRSLQKIRRALQTMKNIGETEHLSTYRLEEQGRQGIVLVQDEGAVDLTDRPGQTLTVVKLGDVLQSFPLDGVDVPNLAHPRENISVDPGVRGGRPVIKGTRVPYELVAGLVRDGVDPDEIADFYPSITPASARDAVDFADYVDHGGRRAA